MTNIMGRKEFDNENYFGEEFNNDNYYGGTLTMKTIMGRDLTMTNILGRKEFDNENYYGEECDTTTCEPPGTNWGGRDMKGNL